MFESLFDVPQDIEDADYIFVSDFFIEDLIGGAELTSEAIIQASLGKVAKVRSANVTMELLDAGRKKFWIFGNFSNLQLQFVPSIVANIKYSIIEFDYKLCKYRSPDRHAMAESKHCNCHNESVGKLISAFYFGAKGLWWMSERQSDYYIERFPFLKDKSLPVLSSVFDAASLDKMKELREKTNGSERNKWIIVGSNSWIKGTAASEAYAKAESLDYDVISNVSYDEMLMKISRAKGLVYMPVGADTCPRIVIETRLLGGELRINENVLHAEEEWFKDRSIEEIDEYLRSTPGLFWHAIEAMKNSHPTISGYVTTYNCIERGYPFKECVQSMLQFCNEVIVLDGGSTDMTYNQVQHMSHSEPRIKPAQIARDWNSTRGALFDGMQKAEARKLCTGDFCWQSDADEIVHEMDVPKILDLVEKFPSNVDIVCLPVIEYWSCINKVRIDINPAKWRLSRNKPNITHGVPKDHRLMDENGEMYSAGSDGCDMIDAETLKHLPALGFMTSNALQVKEAALQGNEQAFDVYQKWFNKMIEVLPAVHHYSWINIEQKIYNYREFWQKFWGQLFNKSSDDTAENNMFFDVPWSQVTDEMIKERAKELSEKTGGHIFHTKWNPEKTTPFLTVSRSQPKVMVEQHAS